MSGVRLLLQQRHKMSLSPVGRPDAAAFFSREGGRRAGGAVCFARVAEAAAGKIAEQKFRMACQEGSNLAFILLRGEGAGGKQQQPARRNEGGRIVKNRRAERSAVFDQSLAVLADGGCLLAEHSFARAGRIDEHAVKQARQRGGKPGRVLIGNNGVGHAHPLKVLAQHGGAAGVVLIRKQQPPPGQRGGELARFAARRGAQVRHPHAGPHAEQRGRGRGAGFLHIKSPGMVPWVAAGAQVCVRQPESGRRKRRWAQRQPALGQKALRGQPQRVGRDAAGRRFGRVAQQRFAAAAEQRAFPRKEGFRVFEHPITCWIYQKSEEFRYGAL